MDIRTSPTDALIVVDVQNDFLPGGALAVRNADQVVPVINRLFPCFQTKVFTRDWHPPNHVSFSRSPAYIDGSWPPHCVQETPGAQFAPDLRTGEADRIISKGTDPDREDYSGFQRSGLASWLRQRKIRRVFVAGLTTEYCVKTTAVDALRERFEVYVIRDAIRGVNVPEGSAREALRSMEAAGVRFVRSGELKCP